VIIFIHVPSTSGTTLFENFSRTYGGRHVIRVFHTEPVDRVRNLFKKVGVFLKDDHPFITGKKPRIIKPILRQLISRPKANEKLGFIGGHLPFKALEDLYNPHDHKLITFIRHPVERLVSEYRRKVRNNRTDFFVGDLDTDLAELANRQKSMLSDFLLSKDDVETDVNILAKKIVSRYFFIGVAEKREQSLMLLMQKLGYPLEGLDLKLNVGSDENKRLSAEKGVRVVNDKYLPDILREKIEKLLAFDIKLYKAIKAEILSELDGVSSTPPAGEAPFKITN